MQWHKLAESELELDFGANKIAITYAGDKKICIGRHQDKLFAFAFSCPHASGILADGYIDGLGNIVCPVHRYKFSLQNGRNTSGEGYYLRHWPLEIRDNGVFVYL